MRKVIIDKMKKLRTRIEKWARVHGHKNLSNSEEHHDDKGRIIWKRSDWEYVDDQYGLMINDWNWLPQTSSYKRYNKLWKKYSNVRNYTS